MSVSVITASVISRPVRLTLKTKCHAKADLKALISPAVTGRLPQINVLILRLPGEKK